MTLTTSNLAILECFDVVPGGQNDLFEHVRKKAAASVANEPSCRRFDVLTPNAGLGNEVVLHEVYGSYTAFEAHQQTWHLRDFRDVTEAIVLSSALEHFLRQGSDHITSRSNNRTDFSKLPKSA
jgi:quinol monooxygenase YgiN